ncbi:MAG: thioredoxin family protein [Thermoanaerobaculia bacterium]
MRLRRAAFPRGTQPLRLLLATVAGDLSEGIRAIRWASMLILACLPLLTASTLLGQVPGRAEKASFSVVADKTAHAPGEQASLAAVMDIERGWHTNSNQPTFEYLIPTKIEIALPAGWPGASIDYPRGEMKTFAFADQPISVYEDEVALIATFIIPDSQAEGVVPVELRLTYQACDDRSCLPPVTTARTFDLTIGFGGQPTRQEIFQVREADSSPTASQKPPTSLPLILLLGVVGGLILNAMPCVLPVLSLKIFGLVKSAGKGRSQVVVGSLATALGILLSFWALALAAILARSAGAAVGWGVQFQEPTFVVVLTLIVILFCLNLWGVFEILLPMRLAQFADSGPKEGVPGHLASGLFATLMATPCSAPFLGTAVSFALSQPASTIFAVFTAIAVGMALPYFILAAAPRAAQLLPKPGPWMDNLRIVMGFLLAAAAIWLLYVLAAQVSRERLAFIELAILGMAMFVWIRHNSTTRGWIRKLAIVGIVVTMVVAVALAAGADATVVNPSATAYSTGLIDWLTFDRQEAERLASAGHLVFVDVTADWCFTCKVNERLVLETPEVAGAFEKYEVISMKADWTTRSDTITQYLADHGRYGIPFYLLYRPDQDPHVFSELLTKEGVVSVIEQASR